MCEQLYVCMHVCMSVCRFVCTFVSIYVFGIFFYMHIVFVKYVNIHVFMCFILLHVYQSVVSRTVILMIIQALFQAFQRYSSSKLVLKPVGSRFAALNYYDNGSIIKHCCL
jgi:hypothetical protein